jgi:dienelactone hydrolase
VESVKIPTPSGTSLDGRFADAGRGAPSVLFFPMCREDAMDGWLPIAERLLNSGVSSLLVTYREYGTSGARVAGDQRTNDADGALAYLRSRIGESADVAVAGSSCGVHHALSAAARHPEQVRAVVALTGPHTRAHVAFLSARADIAVFSGAALEDVPAPDWARELKAASASQMSAMAFANGKAHGTDIFRDDPTYATELATWLAKRLTARR